MRSVAGLAPSHETPYVAPRQPSVPEGPDPCPWCGLDPNCDNEECPGPSPERPFRADLLRGEFAIVRHGDEARMVLLGFEPENRKIVLRAPGAPSDAHDLFDTISQWTLVQSSPGMASRE